MNTRLGDVEVKDIREAMRAAIKTMREPTETMLNAACATEAMKQVEQVFTVAAIHGCKLPDEYYAPNTPLLRWWQAMIDAA